MRASDIKRLLSGSDRLFIQRKGDAFAVSNSHWIVAGENVKPIVDRCTPSQLVSETEKAHTFLKKGSVWELSDITGPDLFEFLEHHSKPPTNELTPTGLVIGNVNVSRSLSVDVSVLTGPRGYHLVQRRWFDALRQMFPDASIFSKETENEPIYFANDGAVVSILMPVMCKGISAMQYLAPILAPTEEKAAS